jgi:hypothetical protein
VVKDLREMIEATTAWVDRTTGIDEAVSAGKITVHLAASILKMRANFWISRYIGARSCVRRTVCNYSITVSGGNMHLKAKHWQNNARANEAANAPFHSLRFKAWNSDDAGAISLLQFALITIEAASPRLLPKDRPTNPPFKGGPWGRFFLDNTDEFKVGTYDMPTELAVRRFQDEAGLEVDGLAGMNTLRRLDKILVAVEKLPKIGPPSP